MQGPQEFSSILAPALIMSANAPFLAIISITCLDPGAITKLTLGLTFLPFSILATFIKSSYEEFVQLPIATWSTFIFPNSFTSLTLSGLWGPAASGTNSSKFIVISSSYNASASGLNSIQSSSLPWALKNSKVLSSLGKIEVVAPNSAPIFVIVALCGTDSDLTPSPAYSNTFPTPPFTVNFLNTSNIISLDATILFNLPSKLTLTTLGVFIL